MPVISPRTEQILFARTDANMDTTVDQALVAESIFSQFIITRIRVVDASASLTTAAGGFYTEASKSGVIVVAASQAYSALTGATHGIDLTIEPAGRDRIVASTLFLSLTTGNGSAATATIYVIGIPIA